MRQAPLQEWSVKEINLNDIEGTLRRVEIIVKRIEAAISILYVTNSALFSSILPSLNNVLENSAQDLLESLQVYAEYLRERKLISLIN